MPWMPQETCADSEPHGPILAIAGFLLGDLLLAEPHPHLEDPRPAPRAVRHGG